MIIIFRNFILTICLIFWFNKLLAQDNFDEFIKNHSDINAPKIISSHNPSTIYYALKVVHKSIDNGANWTVISPNLTRNSLNSEHETLTSLIESSNNQEILYTGSNDGLVHVTIDGGVTWRDITPSGLNSSNFTFMLSQEDETITLTAKSNISYNSYMIIAKTKDFGRKWLYGRMISGKVISEKQPEGISGVEITCQMNSKKFTALTNSEGKYELILPLKRDNYQALNKKYLEVSSAGKVLKKIVLDSRSRVDVEL